jgi:hypothetical protein
VIFKENGAHFSEEKKILMVFGLILRNNLGEVELG